MSFPKIPSHVDFAAIQEEVLQFRKTNKTFEKSIETKSEDNPYRFYDGPPFITGLPHYGGLLSSVVKDVMTRFWTQKGKRIERVRWWDCHGIYVEQKVQEKLWLKSNKEIYEYGIEKFIDACYEYTSNISDQRERYVDHIGRRVDFRNAYKTMDNDYMESVMWVFKSLWEKWMIYKGKRVSLYSTKLNTPISNYEVALDNSYAEIPDPAITVKFPVKSWNQTKVKSEEYELTTDWAIKFVRWIIKDENWWYFMVFNKYWRRQFPWWKLDKWDSVEATIQKKLKEEINIEAITSNKISEIKHHIAWQFWLGIYHEVQTFSGVIEIQEKEKLIDKAYVKVEDSENKLWYQLNIKWTIIDDENEILWKFTDLHYYITSSKINKINDEATPISFLARTTTPRTIPANLALVVSPDITYLQIYDLKANEYFILAENLISKYYKDPSDYLIIYKCKWTELEGISYKAPFEYYTKEGWIVKTQQWNNNFRNQNHHQVYLADYVTDTDGTGIVHTAPEFGEDDFKTGLKYGLIQTQALDEAGNYSAQIYDYTGIYYRDANEQIMNNLKEKWLLFKKESITHSVAMCPRTNVPLIYKTQDSWFINIQSIKDKLAHHNQAINRVPDHLKNGRFAKSMESAPDRCISRTRFRATPMPVWTDGNGEYKVLWSRDEIFDLDQSWSKVLEKRINDWKIIYRDTINNKELDLHRPYIDNIRGTIDDKKFTRVDEVLDPWLESWSMPYAQVHYPFENKEKFEKSFPADYVAEYLGQVRCRFFFMHALWVMLFDSPAFTNVVCTGVLAWNDGRKMSKSYGNYPDPKSSMETLGSDALRMYLCSNPIVTWGDMNFAEEGRKDVIRKINLPLRNSFSFFVTYANIDNFTPSKFSINDILQTNFENDLDTWIIWKTAQLITKVDSEMQSYNMQKATQPIYNFLDDLTNRYIRRSRRRFWKWEMDTEKLQWYETLFVVLVELCKVLAPFMPFLSEYIFKALTGKTSVHLEDRTTTATLSEGEGGPKDRVRIIPNMDLAKQIVELWLSLRWSLKIKVKQPLQSLKVNKNIVSTYQDIIKEELNIKELIIDESLNNQITVTCVPNARIIGKKLWSRFAEINNLAKSGQFTLLSDKKVQVSDIVLESDEYELRYEKWELAWDLITSWDLILMLDTTITPELKREWYARELVRSIQEARKSTWYQVTDKIILSISWFEADQIINQYGEFIMSETLSRIVWTIENTDYEGKCDLEEGAITLMIKKE